MKQFIVAPTKTVPAILRLISLDAFNAELEAGFAELVELSAVTFVGARILASCKQAGLKVKDVPLQEIKELAEIAKRFIVQKQWGKPYDTLSSAETRAYKDTVRDALRKLTGADKVRKAAAKTGAKLPVAPTEEEQDEFPNVPQVAPKPMVNAQPSELILMQDIAKRVRAAKTVSRSDALALADWVMGLSV